MKYLKISILSFYAAVIRLNHLDMRVKAITKIVFVFLLMFVV